MALAISYTFSPTTTIASGQVNQNFTDIVNYINNTASPAGLVCMWKGSIASIPTGWTLDTDLQDKMVIGAGNLYAYAATGGEVNHTLTEAEMPVHTHVQNSHNHTQDAHNHGISTGSGSTGSGYVANTNNGTPGIVTDSKTATNQAATATNQNAGSGAAHNNLPPYYAMAFIRRT